MRKGKLVRDNIPNIIRAKGQVAQTYILNEEEFKRELLRKLREEVEELIESPSLEERADIAEVLRKIDELFGFAPAELEDARQAKYEARGGFEKRIFLEGEF